MAAMFDEGYYAEEEDPDALRPTGNDDELLAGGLEDGDDHAAAVPDAEDHSAHDAPDGEAGVDADADAAAVRSWLAPGPSPRRRTRIPPSRSLACLPTGGGRPAISRGEEAGEAPGAQASRRRA